MNCRFDCVFELVDDVFELLDGLFGGFELNLGLRYALVLIWECFGSGKCWGKTQKSGFAKERRSLVLGRRGARLFLGRGKLSDLLGAAAL